MAYGLELKPFCGTVLTSHLRETRRRFVSEILVPVSYDVAFLALSISSAV
jgi:hypothetical protein